MCRGSVVSRHGRWSCGGEHHRRPAACGRGTLGRPEVPQGGQAARRRNRERDEKSEPCRRLELDAGSSRTGTRMMKERNAARVLCGHARGRSPCGAQPPGGGQARGERGKAAGLRAGEQSHARGKPRSGGDAQHRPGEAADVREHGMGREQSSRRSEARLKGTRLERQPPAVETGRRVTRTAAVRKRGKNGRRKWPTRGPGAGATRRGDGARRPRDKVL